MLLTIVNVTNIYVYICIMIKKYKIKCCVCNTPFQSARPDAKTCSLSCRVKKSQTKTADKKAENKNKLLLKEMLAITIRLMNEEGLPDEDIELMTREFHKLSFKHYGYTIKPKLIRKK